MESPFYTDSRGNLLTARTWGKMQEAEIADMSTVQIVANDIYNTPRDKSPTPADSAVPHARANARPKGQQAQRQSIKKDIGTPYRRGHAPSTAPPAGRGMPAPPSPAKSPAVGRASMRAPDSKRSPPRRASSISRVKGIAAKPAWADVAASPPAKAVAKSRVEMITAPQRRATKDSSRPGTPGGHVHQSDKPAVPSLDLESLKKGSSRSKQAALRLDEPESDPVALQQTPGGAQLDQTGPRILTARGANASSRLASARLGSPRSSRRLAETPGLQRRTSSLKVEPPQTRSTSLQSSLAAEGFSVRSEVLGVRLDVAPSVGSAVGPPQETQQDSSSLPSPSSSRLRHVDGEAEVAPIPSSRLGRQRADAADAVASSEAKEAAGTSRPVMASAVLEGGRDAASPRVANLGMGLSLSTSSRPEDSRQIGSFAERRTTSLKGKKSQGTEIQESSTDLLEGSDQARALGMPFAADEAMGKPLNGIEEENTSTVPRLGTPRVIRDQDTPGSSVCGSFLSLPENASPRPSLTPRRKAARAPSTIEQTMLPNKSPRQSKMSAQDSQIDRGLTHLQSEPAALITRFGLEEEPIRAASLPASLRSATSFESRREFLRRPGPTTGPVHCTILRDLTRKGQPAYSLYLDDPAKLIITACKRKKNKFASYIISVHDQQGDSVCGSVRSNFLGTQFAIFDQTGQKEPSGKGGSDMSEIGLVRYQTNILGTRGPRKMTVLTPALPKDGAAATTAAPQGSMTQRMKDAERQQHYVTLVNKPPKWNDQLGAFCLNFGGRVTHASVKNFQLVAEDNPEPILLQFGKVGKDKFSMDFRWPMSTLQAFGICLSSFDSKLACE